MGKIYNKIQMKFSAILLATLAVSSQAVNVQDYEDSDKYPFGSPYSTSELAAHESELKTIKSTIGGKQVAVQVEKKPVEKVEKKEEPKKVVVQKKVAKSDASIEEREYDEDAANPSHNQGRLFEIMNQGLEM